MPGNVRVFVRRNADGVVADFDFQFWDWESEFPEYIWEEGNYACDCNRALFFASARGEDRPEHQCGDGAYAVRVVGPDGALLYEDGEGWQAMIDEALK